MDTPALHPAPRPEGRTPDFIYSFVDKHVRIRLTEACIKEFATTHGIWGGFDLPVDENRNLTAFVRGYTFPADNPNFDESLDLLLDEPCAWDKILVYGNDIEEITEIT